MILLVDRGIEEVCQEEVSYEMIYMILLLLYLNYEQQGIQGEKRLEQRRRTAARGYLEYI